MEVKGLYGSCRIQELVQEMNDESGHYFYGKNLRTGRLPKYRRYVRRIIRKP